MQTSEQGIEALVLEEGEVLKAYLCPAHKWTIGLGLTAASGVIDPKPGMVITKARSRELAKLALARNYEPRVASAMPGALQHEFDAGVLFDWNTGAIRKASWVKLWVQKAARAAVEAKFRLWNKGGGKVLPGLVKRRDRELKILFDAKYPVLTQELTSKSIGFARWTLTMTVDEKFEAMGAFSALGYKVGGNPKTIDAAEVRRFQSDHALTPDGLIGRATLSTLQRRIDAAAKAKAATPAVGATASAGATTTLPEGTSDVTDWIAAQPWVIGALAGVITLWALWRAWQYRDVIAVKLTNRAPRLAALLRSF
ncbi:lysozyme [Rhodobacter aestuarii]|uniref:Lysozyme n=1 Tax=Rhodobacter aestuarii TaxID=453582 RepID=A0A1N7Q1W4_9RHOB|nr:lysozyme [Rhodobacter aestuarii]PTV94036.1 lysozyme [Rhodobacter aestuarii]SIT16850.1 lysozyme [Rhodobacter aestuarii]